MQGPLLAPQLYSTGSLIEIQMDQREWMHREPLGCFEALGSAGYQWLSH